MRIFLLPPTAHYLCVGIGRRSQPLSVGHSGPGNWSFSRLKTPSASSASTSEPAKMQAWPSLRRSSNFGCLKRLFESRQVTTLYINGL